MTSIIHAMRRHLRAVLMLPVLAACTSPQFDCAQFPEFTGVSSFGGAGMPSAEGTAILREAESFRRVDTRAIVEAYLSFGAYDAAADFVRRKASSNTTRGAVLLLIETSAATGRLDFAEALVDEFGSGYLDGAADLALAAGLVRSGDLDAALVLMDSGRAATAGSGSDRASLSALQERLFDGWHREAALLLQAVLEPYNARAPLFSTIRFRGQTLIAGHADLVNAGNVDQIVTEIAKSNVPDGIAKYSVLFAVADTYVTLGRGDDAAPVLSNLVDGFTTNASGYSDEYLTSILRLQVEIGRYEDVEQLIDYLSRRLDSDALSGDRHAREFAKELASLLSSHGRSPDMYRALDMARTPKSRALLRSTIAWVETMEGNTEKAMQMAAGAEDALARCWAQADIASALALRGQGSAALGLAREIGDQDCVRNAGFAAAPDGSRGPYGDFLTPVTVFDENLFTTIAVAAAHYGDGETVCGALNSGPLYHQWIDAVEEVAALRTAAADYDSAIAFFRSARDIRPSDADDWSEILARMVTHEPRTWSPPNWPGGR